MAKIKIRTKKALKKHISISSGKSNEINIFNLGTLIQFESHAWLAVKRLGKDVAKNIDPEIETGWVKGNKNLVSHSSLTEIKSCITEARDLISRFALPFPIKSIAFIPKDKVNELDEALKKVREKLAGTVDDYMVFHYEREIEKAKKTLKHLWDRADYPSDLRREFSINWRFFEMVIPPGISEDIQREESEKFKTLMEETKQMGILALREGFAEIINHLTDAIQGKLDGEARRIRNDALDRVQQFFTEFKSKNVFGDSELESLISKANKIVKGVSIDSVKSDAQLAAKINDGLKIIGKELDKSTEKIRRKFTF